MLPLDLHVLSLPLAFILSQDQTLRCRYLVFFFSSKYFSVRQVRRNLASYCVCLDLRHILQVGIDTETFLIELSLYLSQPDTLFKVSRCLSCGKMSLFFCDSELCLRKVFTSLLPCRFSRTRLQSYSKIGRCANISAIIFKTIALSIYKSL